MDPASALGVASAAVQFIQFGSSLASQAIKIYKSLEGALPENIECESASKRQAELAGNVKGELEKMGGVVTGSEELGDVCQGYIEVSGELERVL